MSDRATLRPVTLGRLVEVTYLCSQDTKTTEDIEKKLGVSHRRARSTLLEAMRISLLEEHDDDETPTYETTRVGDGFLAAVENEAWSSVSGILETRSPHYGMFINSVESLEIADEAELLDNLQEQAEFEPYDYNEASIDVLGDWAERLGVIQRNAFTGDVYLVENEEVPANFGAVLLSVYDDLEETAGLDLRQRHLSIPKLREHGCERLQCPREAFDSALLALASQNIGRVELSGAPMDTEAKESPRGIKQISLTDAESLVSTDQTSEQVMAGVEQHGKQYYYLAVFERNLTFNPNS